MNATERFATAHDALEYRRAHDQRARALHRSTMPTLRAIEAAALAAAGIQRVSGGPASKDELERAILEREYPSALLNETAHVLYHQPGESWSACEWCQPSAGIPGSHPAAGRNATSGLEPDVAVWPGW